MPTAFSMDIRLRVFEARQSGETTTEVAERFLVSEAFVRKLMQHHQEKVFLKIPASGQKRGRKLSLGEEDLGRLRQLLTEQPDLSARELRNQLGLLTSEMTVWRTLKRLGFTFKKRHNSRLSRRGRM